MRRASTSAPPRDRFLLWTYGHLVVAVIAVVLIDAALFHYGPAIEIAEAMLGVPWLLILGGFILMGWFARRLAWRTSSRAAHYLGLGLYAIAKAFLLVPMLYLADRLAPGAIGAAALVTLTGVVALSLVVFWTRKDFSFLRGLLYWWGGIAFALIVSAVLFRFRLGLWFDVGMISLAGTSILYDTSRLLQRRKPGSYVAAALELFASVALMFWYALRLLRRMPRAN